MRTDRESSLTARVGRVLVTYIAPSVNDVVFQDFPWPQPGDHHTKSRAEQADSTLGGIGGLVQKGLNKEGRNIHDHTNWKAMRGRR